MKLTPIITLMCLALTTLNLQAAAQISTSRMVEKLIPVDPAHPDQYRKVPATRLLPNDQVEYTLRYANHGNRTAHSVLLESPIPGDTTYLIGSAWGEFSNILFSIDGGRTFHPAEQLERIIRDIDGSERAVPVSAAEYTHIRWILLEVPPATSGTVGFQVQVKQKH